MDWGDCVSIPPRASAVQTLLARRVQYTGNFACNSVSTVHVPHQRQQPSAGKLVFKGNIHMLSSLACRRGASCNTPTTRNVHRIYACAEIPTACVCRAVFAMWKTLRLVRGAVSSRTRQNAAVHPPKSLNTVAYAYPRSGAFVSNMHDCRALGRSHRRFRAQDRNLAVHNAAFACR